MFKVVNGKIYNSRTNEFLEDPAILIDGDIVAGIGEFRYLIHTYKVLAVSFRKFGKGVKGVYLFPLLNRLGVHETCYVMNKVAKNSYIGFVSKFVDMYYSDNLLGWLKGKERNKVII